jgi:hypothetical protein
MVRFQPQYPPVQKRLAVLTKGSPALGKDIFKGEPLCSPRVSKKLEELS